MFTVILIALIIYAASVITNLAGGAFAKAPTVSKLFSCVLWSFMIFALAGALVHYSS
jgi:hypothetical protein